MFKAIINMKRNKDAASAAVSIALAFSVFSTLAAIFYVRSQKEVDLGETLFLITGEWKPYTGEDLANSGITAAIVEATVRRMGYKAEFIFSPWTNGLDKLELSETNTEARGAFPFLMNEERLSRFDFSEEPLLELQSSLFYMENERETISPNAKLEDLVNRPAIKISGYSYPEAYEKLAQRNGSIPVENVVEAIRTLISSKESCVLYESTDVGLHIIRSHFAGRTQYLRSVILKEMEATNPVFMVWSRSNPNNLQLKQLFDKALRELKQSGDYDEIFRRISRELDRNWTFSITPRSPNASIVAESEWGTFAVPSGTLVVVERWGPSYFPEKNRETEDFQTHIRFANGPVAGTRAILDGQSVEFNSVP